MSGIIGEPTNEYTERAQKVAENLGLGFKVYKYSAIAQLDPTNFIGKCCEVTGTSLDEQLKFVLAADGTNKDGMPTNPALGVVRYPDRFDFRKIAQVVNSRFEYSRISPGRFSSRQVNPEALGLKPDYIGIAYGMCYAIEVTDPKDQSKKTLYVPVPYAFDEKIRDLNKVCFPVGKGKSDDLVLISHREPLRDKIGKFLEDFFVDDVFIFGDIKKV